MDLLLVDDEPKNLLALSALLEDLGARIHCAASGEEALRQVLKRPFAAIVLDVRMRGIDGFETAAAIRSLERLRRTPILFMSANEDRRRKPRPSAYEHYFRKPLAPDAVRAKLLSFLPLPRAVVDSQHAQAQERMQ